MNPYLALLVSVGLQAWVLGAARLAPGRLPAIGFVLLGLVPAVVLFADLAGRFDAGLGVWQDLLMMVADGQIGVSLALLACLMAGPVSRSSPWPARSPVGRRPRCGSRARSRSAGALPAGEPPLEPEPEPDEEVEPEPEAAPEPAQPEPERDPRLWSKPRGSSSPPLGSLNPTPWPSLT